MNTSENITELAEAFCLAQAKFPTIHKNSQGYGYKYADLTDIINVIRPILADHDLMFLQSIGPNGVLTTRLMHKSGQYMEDSFELPGMKDNKTNMNNVQQMGAQITYCRRYALSSMLGLATDEDTDGVDKAYEELSKKSAELAKQIDDSERLQYFQAEWKKNKNNINVLKSIIKQMEKSVSL